MISHKGTVFAIPFKQMRCFKLVYLYAALRYKVSWKNSANIGNHGGNSFTETAARSSHFSFIAKFVQTSVVDRDPDPVGYGFFGSRGPGSGKIPDPDL